MKRKRIILSAIIFTFILFVVTLFGCTLFNIDYTIMYSDSDNVVHTLTVKSGELYTIEKPLPEKEGYVFAGLFDSEAGGTQYVGADGISISPFKGNKDIKLYPRFTPKTYTITLDYGEADVVGAQTFSMDYDGTFPAMPASLMVTGKDYMVFEGWYTERDCGGEKIADKYGNCSKKFGKEFADLAESNGGITLYAGFSVQKCAVSFYENDGKTLLKEVEVVYGTPIADIMPQVTTAGKKIYSWTAWLGVEYEEKTVTSCISLYVLSYACDIEYDYGYDGKKETVTVAGGKTYELLKPARKGYDFNGWYNDNRLQYSTVFVNGDLKLTAKWTAKTYDITYSVNNAEGTLEDTAIKVTYGSSFNLAVPESNRTEYDFDGWSTQDGTALTDSAGKSLSVWNITDDITVYANWKLVTYTVTLNSNGGTNGGSATVNRGATYTIPISTRIGYTFEGWYDDTTGERLAGRITLTEDISLTAKWTANTYTVTLDAQGGTVSTDTVTLKFDSVYSLPVPTKGTDVFIGWFTLATGGTQLTTGTGSANGVWQTAQDTVVYAQWRQLRTINLDTAAPCTVTVGNEEGVVLKGTVGKTYSGVNVVINDSALDAYVYLENVNIVGNSSNGTVYCAQTISRKVIITSIGTENSITGCGGAKGVSAYNLSINGSAPLTIIGGNGANATVAGWTGGGGSVGIYANTLTIQLDALLTVKGGNGGNGKDGANGVKGGDCDKNDGGNGKNGGNGGSGGIGASAIKAVTLNCYSAVNATSGDGGNGGKGGNGGDAGHWHNIWSCGAGPGKGGDGGSGGNGGVSQKVVSAQSVFGMDMITQSMGLCGARNIGGSGGAAGYHTGNFGHRCEGKAGLRGGDGFGRVAYTRYGGHTYVLFNYWYTWTGAKEKAVELNGHLATITSQGEDEALKTMVKNVGYINVWLGATDEDSKGNWKWVTGETWSYTGWSSGEPNNDKGNENYMSYDISYCWNDVSHDNPAICGFIVEFE